MLIHKDIESALERYWIMECEGVSRERILEYLKPITLPEVYARLLRGLEYYDNINKQRC